MVRKPPACLSEECNFFAQNASSWSICNPLIGVYTGIGSPQSAEAASLKLMIHSILQLRLLPICVCYRLPPGHHTYFPPPSSSKPLAATLHLTRPSSSFVCMPLFPVWPLPERLSHSLLFPASYQHICPKLSSSQLGPIFVPRKHLAMSQDFCNYNLEKGTTSR